MRSRLLSSTEIAELTETQPPVVFLASAIWLLILVGSVVGTLDIVEATAAFAADSSPRVVQETAHH